VFTIPWSSRWSWSLHLFLGRPMFLRSFGWYCSAFFGIIFVSILCTCYSHYAGYGFISFTVLCAPVFSLIHWFFLTGLNTLLLDLLCCRRQTACSSDTLYRFRKFFFVFYCVGCEMFLSRSKFRMEQPWLTHPSACACNRMLKICWTLSNWQAASWSRAYFVLWLPEIMTVKSKHREAMHVHLLARINSVTTEWTFVFHLLAYSSLSWNRAKVTDTSSHFVCVPPVHSWTVTVHIFAGVKCFEQKL
jgi:hypothetical protein